MRRFAVLATVLGLGVLAGACGTSRTATIELCAGHAVHGRCASTTHVLKSFRGQDIVVRVSPQFGVDRVALLTFAKVGAKWTLIDRATAAVAPSADNLRRRAARWGATTPWPAGRYRLVVQIAAANLGSTQIKVP